LSGAGRVGEIWLSIDNATEPVKAMLAHEFGISRETLYQYLKIEPAALPGFPFRCTSNREGNADQLTVLAGVSARPG